MEEAQKQKVQKGRGEAAPKSHCPKCESAARYVEAKKLTKRTKELYFQCTNLKCSIRFVDQQTTVRIIQNKKLSSDCLPVTQPDEEFGKLAA